MSYPLLAKLKRTSLVAAAVTILFTMPLAGCGGGSGGGGGGGSGGSSPSSENPASRLPGREANSENPVSSLPEGKAQELKTKEDQDNKEKEQLVKEKDTK